MSSLTPRQYAEQIYNPALYPTKESVVSAIHYTDGHLPHQDIVQAVDDVWAERLAAVAPEWETPAHREVDVFDPEYDECFVEQGLIPFVKVAIDKGFHVFGLTPKDKVTLP